MQVHFDTYRETEHVSVYTDNGYENRREYLVSLAEDYGVPIDRVLVLAALLGPNEDFDGLVNAVEDMADGEF